MKTNNIILAISFLFISSLKAQELYSEDFENFTIGYVGSDATGQASGQGGWFTASPTQLDSLFQIQNDPANGKVITVTGNPYLTAGNTGIRKDIDEVIIDRIIGNNVFKFEMDFYTAQPTGIDGEGIWFGLGKKEDIGNIFPFLSTPIVGFSFYTYSGELRGIHNTYGGTTPQTYFLENNQPLILPFDTWVSLVIYADYINNKIIYEIPSLGLVSENDFFPNFPYPTNINNHLLESINIATSMIDAGNGLPTYRFDNFKVTALNSSLSVEEVLSNSFLLYPNPAVNLVTITNPQNTFIKQIEIYDLTGKLINTQNYFEDKTEIELNVEKLATSVYLLHLQTDERVVVKKLIKR
ncbi:MAG: T9SS type A sorting domain-containing protein [Flavobacteriaceae bacterium]